MKRLLIALLVIVLLVAGYAFYVEPFWVVVTHHRIEAHVASPFKVMFLTDIHTRGFGRREKRILQAIHDEKPDAILIAGDTIRHDGTYAAVQELYGKLRARRGVWFTRGNWEVAQPPEMGEVEFFRQTKVRWMKNSAVALRPDFWIVGVDDSYRGTPDFERAIKDVPKGVYTVAFFHSPEYFNLVAGRVDLVLAGHTHGGQVKFPLFPPAYCPPGCGPYLSGWYERGGTRLYVSRGIGTSILEVRLGSRPEIAIFTFEPPAQKQ